MEKNKALAYYFPTTVILIDDNLAYLENIENILDRSMAVYRTFTNPKKAYEFLTKHSKKDILVDSCINQETDPYRGHRNIDINLNSIQNEIYNHNRFNNITVIVADHDMPEMQGLELFESLKNDPAKKLLVTGVASDKDAIKAFNAGIINQFMNKDTKGFEIEINLAIKQLQYERFQEESLPIMDSLLFKRPGYNPPCINNQQFISVFNEIIINNKICEYYLIDDRGSYLFLDIDAKPSWLIIKDEDDIASDVLLAEDSDVQPSNKIITQLKSGDLLLCMLSHESRGILANQWLEKNVLYPAKKLECDNNKYYYTYITSDDQANLDIESNRILAFRQFQRDFKF